MALLPGRVPARLCVWRCAHASVLCRWNCGSTSGSRPRHPASASASRTCAASTTPPSPEAAPSPEPPSRLGSRLSRSASANQGSAIEQLFRRFDTDGNGTLDYDEFLGACAQLGLRFPQEELEMLFMQSDCDEDGCLDLEEFRELMTTLRWRRQELVTSGQWTDNATVNLLGQVNFDDFMAWVDTVVGQGKMEEFKSISRSFRQKARAKEVERELQLALRSIFSNLDMNTNGEVNFEALQIALHGVGVDLQEDALREMVAEFDSNNSGEICFDEFERTFSSTYFNKDRAAAGRHAGHWKNQLRRSLESRMRAPPPPRPDRELDGLFPVGSVKPPDEASRTDRQYQELGKATLRNSLLSPSEEKSMVTIRVECINLPSLADKVKSKQKYPSHPCRPVALLNFQEPRNHTWFDVGHSDWLGGSVKPFEISTTLEYFETLPALEICMYDLENGEGTAKIKVSTMFIPNHSMDVAKAVSARRRRGSLLGHEVGGQLRVRIEEGSQLPKMDQRGLSDPYAIVRIGEKKYKTHTQTATLYPKWDETFVFDIDWKQSSLIINVRLL